MGAMSKVIERDPLVPESYFNLGLILRAVNRDTEAESAFRKALELDPKNADATGNLGAVLGGKTQHFRDMKNADACLATCVTASCGGFCSCATCHVYVDPEWVGRLQEMQSDEKELVSMLTTYNEKKSRLSCQVTFTDALDGVKLTVAPEE